MGGDEGGIFSKTPHRKSLFLLKTKNKQTQALQMRNIM